MAICFWWCKLCQKDAVMCFSLQHVRVDPVTLLYENICAVSEQLAGQSSWRMEETREDEVGGSLEMRQLQHSLSQSNSTWFKYSRQGETSVGRGLIEPGFVLPVCLDPKSFTMAFLAAPTAMPKPFVAGCKYSITISVFSQRSLRYG